MSSYGILVNNNNGQVLISEQTLNLHFYAKYSSPSSYVKLKNTTQAGGGINIANYTITCGATPVPFFTTPNPDYFYAISRITQIDNITWNIEVIKSGNADYFPELYIFTKAAACTSSGETYGLVVYQNFATGEVSFDSRLRPLTVSQSFNVLHPTLPRASVSTAGLSARYIETFNTSGPNFAPQYPTTYSVSGGISSKPIFCFFSLAQAEMQTPTLYDSDRRDRVFYDETDEYWAVMWTIYRGGVTCNSSTNTISAGWIAIDNGYVRTARYNQRNFLGYSGFNFNGGDFYAQGYPAWSNKSINNTTGTSLIIGNALRYD